MQWNFPLGNHKIFFVPRRNRI